MNTTETGNPPPFNETVDNAAYLGLEKTSDMSRYVRVSFVVKSIAGLFLTWTRN